MGIPIKKIRKRCFHRHKKTKQTNKQKNNPLLLLWVRCDQILHPVSAKLTNSEMEEGTMNGLAQFRKNFHVQRFKNIPNLLNQSLKNRKQFEFLVYLHGKFILFCKRKLRC